MNLGLFLGQLILVVSLVLGVEGLNSLSGGEIYLASIKHLAQETTSTPSVEPSPPAFQETVAPVIEQPLQLEPEPEENTYNGNFVDPQEVKRVLGEIRDLKGQVKIGLARLKKIVNSQDAVAKLGEISADLDRIKAVLSNPATENSDLRIALQEFYDGRFWDEIDEIRFVYEFPKEYKDMTRSLKRLEKMIATKSVKALGLNLERVQATVAELRSSLDLVKSHYDRGEFEEAMEISRDTSENLNVHPGEIEGTIFRIRDIKKMIKKVKDESIRTAVEGALQEVIDAFDSGDYREANETLNEYADDLMDLLSKFIRKTRKADDDSFSRIQNLEQLIIQKLQEGEGNSGEVQ